MSLFRTPEKNPPRTPPRKRMRETPNVEHPFGLLELFQSVANVDGILYGSAAVWFHAVYNGVNIGFLNGETSDIDIIISDKQFLMRKTDVSDIGRNIDYLSMTQVFGSNKGRKEKMYVQQVMNMRVVTPDFLLKTYSNSDYMSNRIIQKIEILKQIIEKKNIKSLFY